MSTDLQIISHYSDLHCNKTKNVYLKQEQSKINNIRNKCKNKCNKSNIKVLIII